MQGSTPKKKKLYLKALARQNFLCCLCGTKILFQFDNTEYRPTWEHFNPISRGGKDKTPNKYVAHYKCNHRKGDMNLEEAFQDESFLKLYWFMLRRNIIKDVVIKQSTLISNRISELKIVNKRKQHRFLNKGFKNYVKKFKKYR